MRRRTTLPLLAAAFILVFGTNFLRAQIVTYTWTGRYDDWNFEEPRNWLGGVTPVPSVLNTRIVFAGGFGGHVDFYEIYANQLKFDGITRTVELHGGYDTTHLGSGGVVYAPAGNVRSYLSDRVQLHANQVWDIQAGTLVLEGPIGDEFFDSNSEAWVSANYSLTKTGAGTLVLDTYDSYNWGGGLILNQGRLGLTWYTGYYEGLGQGPLTVNGGTLVAMDPYEDDDEIYITNDIVINGTLTAENDTELRLGFSGDGESNITLNADTTIRSSGDPLFLSGHITDNGAGRKLTIDSTGPVIIDGPTSYSGGTDVTKGVLIFDRPGLGSNLPASGNIKVGALGYAGITSNGDVTAFISKIDPTSTGSIGFDSDPDGASNLFSTPIDLSGLNASVRIGTATHAILGTLFDVEMQPVSSATITPFGNTYRFGGGGGTLEVQTPLVDAPGPVSRNVVLDSPAQLPLSVFFTSPSNNFTGGASATHSAAVFLPNSLPGTGTLSLGDGGYIGMVGLEGVDAENPAQDFINRFAASTDRGMIGFDSSSEHTTITDPISLAGFSDSSPGIYLGTHTLAHLDGPITPQGTTFRFGAYKGGQLTVNAQLSGAGNSVVIGDPTSLGTMGDFFEEEYSQVIMQGNNSYGGTTTLYAGELIVGQTNGVAGTDPTTALGTGALIVQPHSLTLPDGHEDVRPQIATWGSIIIPNALQLNADVTLYGYESSATYTGNLTGNGEIYTDGAVAITLTGNNSGFSGGIYLSGYTNLYLGNDTAAGTGPMGFGYGSYLNVYFQSAAPVLGGLYSNSASGDAEYDYYEDYGVLTAEQPNTVLTINQANDGAFSGEFRSDHIDDGLRIVKQGAGTLHLVDGGLYFYKGVNVTTPVGDREVNLQVNSGTVVLDDLYVEGSQPTMWVNGGTLAVTGGTYVSNPVLVTSGKLAGDGYFGTTTIGANAVLSPGLPGAPIGQLGFPDLTLAGGGLLEWNLRTADPELGDHDLVTIGQITTLHITAATADDPNTPGDERFTLKLISLGADGLPGTVTGFSGDRSYTWTIFDATYSSVDGFDPSKFVVDASQFFTDLEQSTFELSLSADGKLVQLTFQPVPEPSTYALMAIGLGFVGLTLWRRRRA